MCIPSQYQQPCNMVLQIVKMVTEQIQLLGINSTVVWYVGSKYISFETNSSGSWRRTHLHALMVMFSGTTSIVMRPVGRGLLTSLSNSATAFLLSSDVGHVMDRAILPYCNPYLQELFGYCVCCYTRHMMVISGYYCLFVLLANIHNKVHKITCASEFFY